MPSFVPIEIGSIIAKKYAIERIVGEGGMGVVVAAQHTQLRQRVAIKFLLPAIVAHPESLARFVREARASVRIQSEHVARVLDVGELENGSPYIVMEYLEGTDFAGILESATPPSVEAAIEYILQACEAVAEAHSLGIVHRDLKPANLFVTRRPDGSPLVKVLDFGISKSLDGSDHALTKTTSFVGSPMYASPEQLLSSRSVDTRTDIWSLGVILYEACGGQAPFTGVNVMEVASRVMKLDPRPLEEICVDLPVGLSAVIMRCLEKDVARRFATVGELARALGRYAPRAAVSVERISRLSPATDAPVSAMADTVSSVPPPASIPPRLTPAPAPLVPASTQAEWDQRVSRPTGRPASPRLVPFALGFGALLVIGSAGFVLARSRHPGAAAIADPSASAGPEPNTQAAAPPIVPAPEGPAVASASEPAAAPSASASAAAPASAASARPSPAKPHASATASAVVPKTQEAPRPPPPPPVASPPPRNPLDIQIK